jgi:hypothetical protein
MKLRIWPLLWLISALVGLLTGGLPAHASCQYFATTQVLTDGVQLANNPCDTTGSMFVNPEGQKATYAASIVGLVPAAAATDIVCITGSATKTVRVQNFHISGIATAATAANIVVLKRSTANSGGTSTAPTRVALDSVQAAATATVLAYTANNTPGTLVGNTDARTLPLGLTTAPSPATTEFNFGSDNRKVPVLRGITQVLCLNWAGQTIAGNLVNVDTNWTEE